MTQLKDRFGRLFPYLRLSVTDVCNFSCQYCLPDGYQCDNKKDFLTLEEIRHLLAAFAELGTKKVRLTGGEPSVRKDFTDIIKTVATTPGIEKVAVTTNGYKLKERIAHWVEAGLTHLNVSVDSLDEQLFYSLTGHNRLKQILEAIDYALELPLRQIKLNAVLLKGINDHQFDSYTELLRDKPISMRFIELMQTGDNLEYFNTYHVSSQVLHNYLFSKGWQEKIKGAHSGPAKEYYHPEYRGTMGIIAPYSKDFCDSCNRLRVSSQGDFHLCLFGEHGYPIRHLLQHPSQKQLLKQHLVELLQHKKAHHFLHQGNAGGTPHLASVGG